MVAHETGMAKNALRFGYVLYVAQHETDKAVTLAPDAIHHFAAIDTDIAIDMNAKVRCFPHCMGGLGSGNEELARHAANACAGGAVVAVFDHGNARTCRFGSAEGNKPCGAGSDDCNVNS